MGNAVAVKLGKEEYAIIPMAEYERLRLGRGAPAGSVDALDYGRALLGRDLRAAREQAGLTQTELAVRLGKSQTLVSGAEGGRLKVSDRYVSAVLAACGLPADWTPATKAKGSTRRQRRA
ncbi:MAG: helix-turn-helix transcriptional regulator [Deltaproteobacteria bacterium]|nr:helix-turn-helix transcriptional regulator [Deltaproteobacteria bacterium]